MYRWLTSLTRRFHLPRPKAELDRLFAALVEAAPDCIQVLNPDGTRRFINRAGLAMLGAKSFKAIAHRKAWEFIAAAEREGAKAWLTKLLQGEPGKLELSLIGLDGKERRVETRGVPLTDSSGKIYAALLITRDLSEHHRTCLELAKISRLYRMLSQINQLILRRPGRKVLLERIAQIMLREGGFKLVWIALSDHQGQFQPQVLLTAEPGLEASRAGKELTHLACQVVSQNHSAVKRLGQPGVEAEAFALPIQVRGRAVGALAICADRGFSATEAFKLLEELAANLGFALEFEAISVERKLQEEELKFLAYHDPLTSLPNRRLLLEHLGQTIAHAQRLNLRFALVLLDLDRFKDVNDCFGHSMGDRLLVQVARWLKQRLRASDLLARLGGDEFALVLNDLTAPEDAGQVAAELIQNLKRPWQLSEAIEAQVGLSCGIALFPDHGQDATTLLQHADAALYQAKALGRGRFCYFSPELTELAHHRLYLANRLRLALQQEELKLYFQVQLDRAGKVIGAEALLRWSRQGQLIPPSEFLPIAEQTGFIADLDLWVIKALCHQGRAWLEAGLPVPLLAANLSPKELSRRRLDREIAQILETTGFPAQLLALELTETALMEQGQEATAILTNLRALGISLALDDFGTGYSSLAQLKRLPLDLIKIDKCFVDDLPKLKEDCEIASAIIAMSHALGLKVLAEGVETQEQFQFLARLGCDFYQGYLYSRPLPAEEFASRWLQSNLTLSLK
jgi:diguanylate cyclase (GGDEF)-like protein/PAS domain S-box-containing protein